MTEAQPWRQGQRLDSWRHWADDICAQLAGRRDARANAWGHPPSPLQTLATLADRNQDELQVQAGQYRRSG